MYLMVYFWDLVINRHQNQTSPKFGNVEGGLNGKTLSNDLLIRYIIF